MFKTKLQELCHQKRWALPIYSCLKDGEDHNPQFKASVVVNGINFDTLRICKSLKESHNEVAKLAFLHFTSATCEGSKTDQRQKALDISSNASSVESHAKAACGGSRTEEAQKNSEINSTASSIEDVQENYKTKLQIYAERKKLGLPIYHTKREVQSDALSFRAIVTVGENSFVSPGFYKATKSAEDAAAQAALLSLTMVAFHEDDVSLYKNQLQDFAMERGSFMPEYRTMKSGEGHSPIFFSTVEVDGEIFHGNPAKSKKEAELSSARIAYSCLMQRKSCSNDDYSSSSSKDEALELAPALDSLTLHDQPSNLKPGSPTISTSCTKFVPQAEESKDEEIAFTGNISRRAKFSDEVLVIASQVLSDSTSNKRKAGTKIYLLGDRIKVYTFIPDVTFTKGNVTLPIAEGKWTVVNLEFPREKDT